MKKLLLLLLSILLLFFGSVLFVYYYERNVAIEYGNSIVELQSAINERKIREDEAVDILDSLEEPWLATDHLTKLKEYVLKYWEYIELVEQDDKAYEEYARQRDALYDSIPEFEEYGIGSMSLSELEVYIINSDSDLAEGDRIYEKIERLREENVIDSTARLVEIEELYRELLAIEKELHGDAYWIELVFSLEKISIKLRN